MGNACNRPKVPGYSAAVPRVMRGRVADRVDANAPRIGMVNEGVETLPRDPIQEHQVPPEGHTDGRLCAEHSKDHEARVERASLMRPGALGAR